PGGRVSRTRLGLCRRTAGRALCRARAIPNRPGGARLNSTFAPPLCRRERRSLEAPADVDAMRAILGPCRAFRGETPAAEGLPVWRGCKRSVCQAPLALLGPSACRGLGVWWWRHGGEKRKTPENVGSRGFWNLAIRAGRTWKLAPAASYSPTRSPVQYHRR